MAAETREESGREIRNVQDTTNYFENRVLPLIQKKDSHIERAGEILHNEAELKKHDKRWLALAIVYENYRELRNDPHLFINRLKARINEIESYDKELAQYIMSAGVDNKEAAVLNELAERLKAIPEEQAIYFMRKYGPYYLREFSRFKDEEAVDEFKRTLFMVTGEEVYYLNRDLRETRQWPLAARTQGIGYFIRRLNIYLKDNFPGYKGLASDFKDKEIAKKVRENKAVRRLFNYEEEERFFDNVMRYIAGYDVRKEDKTIHIPGVVDSLRWEADFVDVDDKVIHKWSYYKKGGFHDNLKKGRKFIKLVREKYGNKEFADFLEYLEKKYREQPSAEVETRIIELDRLLKSAKYQIRNVILPAAEQLEEIFSKRIGELEKERGKALDKLKKFIDNRLKEIRKSPETAVNRLMRKVKNKESKIKLHWGNIRREFDIKDIRIQVMVLGIERYAGVMEELELDTSLNMIRKINNSRSKWTRYFNELAKRARRIPLSAARMIPRYMVAVNTIEDSMEMVHEQIDVMEESVLHKMPKKMRQLLEKCREISRLQDELILYLIQTGIISEKDLAKANLVLVKGETKEHFAVRDISVHEGYKKID